VRDVDGGFDDGGGDDGAVGGLAVVFDLVLGEDDGADGLEDVRL
jgi:hypothetical protein